ncbi:hypothetical protein ACG98G_04760 [Megasphaera hexanoica]|uniref:Uncharacterized protein n=1 Tax=Megasphaera hexanoica TaxID=1675036 RepID=A0ABW7DP01_9FIRM|nr:hypothetical protein [Megasphaera hexanoica]AXB82592.1 hypothetical protein ACT01_10315 [Megasphaera hexanoica]
MVKKQPDYLTASAMQNYTPSYSTQAVPQLQFAQYAWNDPKFALGMLLGNLGGQYLGSKLEKDAAQRQFRRDNPTAIPDNAKLFDTNSIPTNANGNYAVGTAYNKFNGDNGVSNDFLTNLQNVQGKLQYDPTTGAATGYQTPAFLPSMQAQNNLYGYYPTAVDGNGNIKDTNFSFSDYLNGQTAPNGGQGLLNFSQLQAMAGGNNAADNPVSQSMGVLPTANVQAPNQSNASIPAITGRLGNPINGSLNMNTSALSLPWQGKFDYLKKAGDDVAASSPADGTAAPQPIKDEQPIKNEQPIKAVEGPITNEQPIKEQSDQAEQKQPEMVDNPQYVALRTLMNKEKDPKKKAAMAAELNNIPAKVENWSWGPSNENTRIDMTGGVPEKFSASDRENEFVRSELMRGTPASVINAVVNLARPQWQAKEQAYNRYQESQLYPAYYTAAALGNYPAAAQIAQGMEQYNPQLAATMIAGLPTGLNFYSTQVAKEKAAQGQKYKRENMQVQHGYDIERDNNNSRNRINQSLIEWRQRQIYKNWEMAEKHKYDKATLSEKVSMLQSAGMSYNDAVKAAYGADRKGSTGGSGRGSSGDKQRYQELKDWVNNFEDAHKGESDDTWKSDPDYVARKVELDKFTEPQYDPNNASDLYRFASRAIMSGKYTNQEIINALNSMNDDMAPSIIGNLQSEGYLK